MYRRKVDVDTLNAVKIKLADGSSVSSSSEQRWDCDGIQYNTNIGIVV